MTKWAVVFVGDPHVPPKPKPDQWDLIQYDRANRFMEGLKTWGYLDSQILVVGDHNMFNHGIHRGECETDNVPPGVDNLGPVLQAIQVQGGVTNYTLWISDNCPCVPNGPKFRVKQHGKPPVVEHDPDNPGTYQIIKNHLDFMTLNRGYQMTAIFSGKGSGNIASKLHQVIADPSKITMIASSSGTNDYDTTGAVDLFNIGIVMPQVTPDDYNSTSGAYWAEVARLNGTQDPLMWPGP